jgi:predicted metal-dependent peptidase
MAKVERSPELVEALSCMINQQPFFAVLTFNLLEIQETDSLPGGAVCNTAATDGRRLYISPKFFKKLTVQERVFVIAHEITHVILQHPGRAKGYIDIGFGPDMKPFQMARLNMAADYVINAYLNELKVGHQPAGTLLNAQFDSTWLVDDVYCKIPELEDDDPSSGGGGQGGWDQHLPGDQANDVDGSGKAEIARAVAMAAGAARAIGNLPGALKRLIDEIIDPEIPWEQYLERNIQCIYGNDEATWSKVNRRRLAVAPHVPWPGRIGSRCGNLALEIDTSGSIGDETLTKFLGIFSGILKSVMPETVYCMYVDAKLYNDEVIEIQDLSELEHLKSKAGGGGGTDMTVVFREIEERALEVEAVVVLTDGATPFGEDVGIPTIWCIVDNESVTAPWGTTIHVKL